MRFRNIKYYFLPVLLYSLQPLAGQIDIQGIVNIYTPIEAIYGISNLNNDSVRVADVTGFSPGDTVMIYQVKGADIDIDPGDDGKIGNNRYSTGKYAIMKIDSIQAAGRLIFLNSTLPEMTNPYHSGEMGQLIRVPSYRRARVTSTLTAKDWDPASGTGGVLAIYVERTLELQANIDVTGKGFLGGRMGTEAYTGNCSLADLIGYAHTFFPESSTDSAGFKGEGIADSSFHLLRGRGRNINGGGGGNGRYSGGAGGGNYRPGGAGGNESYAECQPGAVTNGMGGYELSGYYTNIGLYANRIFLGGGGGTGTQNPGSGKSSTPGGDGGGIVVIVTDSLIGNGHHIIANGASVTSTATAAGGGGGGGGAIVMDASIITGLSIFAHGGNGGNTNHPADTTGPGGGGGGGAYWLSGFFQPDLFIDDTTAGRPGIYVPRNKTFGATEGGKPSVIWDLKIPLRGFLFNTVPEGTTVCADVIPDPVIGSEPKGGNGPGSYIYSWLFRTNSTAWAEVPGATGRDFTFTAPLSDTTYLRRIVESGVSLVDTSPVITINVHPRITGNLIGDPDTVCYGLAPLPLASKAVLGGGPYPGVPASYSYHWLQSSDGSTWVQATGTTVNEGYIPPSLTDTIFYARAVTAGVCDDTSNIAEITVLSSLLGNTIGSSQVICYSDTPDQLDGAVPTGGLPADRRYRWQSSDAIDGSYTDIAATKSYPPPSLTDSVFYRRIALSGLQNECMDTSNTVSVIVLSLIGSNTVSASDSVCAGTNVTGLTGTNPTGGDFSYRHLWQKSTDLVSWDSVTQFSSNVPFDPGVLNDTTWFRRIVKSGLNDVCKNTSNIIEISVLPVIVNNLIPTPEVLLCEGSGFPLLNATFPSGGNGGYAYKWEQSENDSLHWNTPGFGTVTLEDYDPGQRIVTTYFRRIVWSGLNGICRDTSIAWEGLMQDSVRNNEVTGYLHYTCYNTAPDPLDGTPATLITGGDESNYTFKWEERSDLTAYGPPAQTAGGEDYQPEALITPRYYRRIVTSGVCADTTPEVSLLIHQLPRADLAGYTDTICEGTEAGLVVSLRGEPGWSLTYDDQITGQTTVNGLAATPAIIQVSPETDDSLTYVYTLVALTDGNGCSATPDSLFGTVTLRVYQTPVAEILTRDSEVCDTVFTLTTKPDNGTGTWEFVSGPGSLFFDDIHAGNGVARIVNQPSQFGTYTLKFTRVSPRCPGEPDQTTLTFFEKPDPAFAGEDIILSFNDQTTLHADPATAGEGWWSVVSGTGTLADSLDPFTMVTGLTLNDSVIFRWNVLNGVCPLSADEVAIIRDDVKYFGGFSPNGDGINDYYVILGLKYVDEFEMHIFNSWGVPVRTITQDMVDPSDLITQGTVEDELKLWDGTGENGNVVPEGTYYFWIRRWKDGQELQPDKGYIIVKTK
ncbi:MAG: gliding motility-associated C-terminal domain-containing protein [Bacteroidota bacterium]